jgi:hypothetical protein
MPHSISLGVLEKARYIEELELFSVTAHIFAVIFLQFFS